MMLKYIFLNVVCIDAIRFLNHGLMNKSGMGYNQVHANTAYLQQKRKYLLSLHIREKKLFISVQN